MKAILEFNLPEDQGDFEIATKAVDYMLVLEDLETDFLRRKLKYESDSLSEDYIKALEDVRAFIIECRRDRGLL